MPPTSADSHDPVPRRGGILREGYDYDFSRCDPTGAHVDPAWCAVYETVTVCGPDGALGPMLAEEWRQDPARETLIRFRIRPGLSFQSGEDCDAAAVADALRLHGDPVEAPINAFFWRNVAGVSTEGRRGGRRAARAERRRAAAPTLLALGDPQPGPPGSRATISAGRPATGPGRSRSWSRSRDPISTSLAGTATAAPAPPGRRTTARHTSTGVRWIPILDDRNRAAALESGEVDCIQNASLLDVDRLAENPDIEVIEFQQSALVYLGLDHETADLGSGDVRVRKAISRAIDRRALVEQDLKGHGWAAYGPIPSHSQWYSPEVEAAALSIHGLRLSCWTPRASEACSDGTRLELEALVVNDATVRRAPGLSSRCWQTSGSGSS